MLKEEVANLIIKKALVREGDFINLSFSNARLKEIRKGKLRKQIDARSGIAPCFTKRIDSLGVCLMEKIKTIGNYMSPTYYSAGRVVDKNGIVPAVMENHGAVTATKVATRIRKLTPRECIRLMGFDDSDYEKMKSVDMSDTQIYKQAGNSIVVNVLVEIFKNLLLGDEK